MATTRSKSKKGKENVNKASTTKPMKPKKKLTPEACNCIEEFDNQAANAGKESIISTKKDVELLMKDSEQRRLFPNSVIHYKEHLK